MGLSQRYLNEMKTAQQEYILTSLFDKQQVRHYAKEIVPPRPRVVSTHNLPDRKMS